MKGRPDYTKHPAYAEYERLAYVEGDIVGGVRKICEAIGIDMPEWPIPTSWLGALRGEQAEPEAQEVVVCHRSQDAIDPASPFNMIVGRRAPRQSQALPPLGGGLTSLPPDAIGRCMKGHDE
jgi:hypothetical protein